MLKFINSLTGITDVPVSKDNIVYDDETHFLYFDFDSQDDRKVLKVPVDALGIPYSNLKSQSTNAQDAIDELFRIAVKKGLIPAPVDPNDKIYGVHWNGTSSVGQRTDDAINFINPTANLSNGYGSSPFDIISPWKDMTICDRSEGVMVSIPKFYYKWSLDGDNLDLQISKHQFDGSYVSPAHMDREDGNGEKDIVYIGRYLCSSTNYKSLPNVLPKNKQTISEFRTNIHNLGSNIWQCDYAMLCTIRMLYLVEYANWDCFSTIGEGCSAASDIILNTGGTDNSFYHTGTSSNARNGIGRIQYRNIEDLWSNIYQWYDGIYVATSIYNIIKNPSMFLDKKNGTEVGTKAKGAGYITSFEQSNVPGYEWVIYPKTIVKNSDGSYIYGQESYSIGTFPLHSGGQNLESPSRGLFYNGLQYDFNYSQTFIGSRIMEL